MEVEEKDISKLHSIGIKKEDLLAQISLLKNLTEKIRLTEAASIGNGILSFSEEEATKASNFYHNFDEHLELVNFVPASGAATRMFKSLIQYLDTKTVSAETDFFFNNLDKFPFYGRIQDKFSATELKNIGDQDIQLNILQYILGASGLNYANEPKGLIPFHLNNGKPRTAFEEHLLEARQLVDEKKNMRLHFTVGLAHRDNIKKHINKALEDIGDKNFTVQYSLQSKTTDTVALDANNQLLRDVNGDIVFRPGGHGSLLNNLNNLHADLIFLKNIDNIIPVSNQQSKYDYKSSMAGFLLDFKRKRDQILIRLNEEPNNKEAIEKGLRLIESSLKYCHNVRGEENDRDYVWSQLNRPIRICGMVKNEGEPGGGPFIVEENHRKSLQIVEASQIDKSDSEQIKIMQGATHFNPVDIICATRDHNGEKYNLFNFREESTSFVSNKSFKGQEIIALEWPGLWNGGMYYWITFFVEIPSHSFNPVKTVNDLLNPAHQGKLK